MKLVLIEWVDITKHSTGWIPVENAIDNMAFIRCQSVGFMVHRDKESVVLTATKAEGAIRDTLVIPAKVIKKIRFLK